MLDMLLGQDLFYFTSFCLRSRCLVLGVRVYVESHASTENMKLGNKTTKNISIEDEGHCLLLQTEHLKCEIMWGNNRDLNSYFIVTYIFLNNWLTHLNLKIQSG